MYLFGIAQDSIFLHRCRVSVDTNRRYGGVAVDVLLEMTRRRPGRFPGKGRRCHWRDASDRCVLRVVHTHHRRHGCGRADATVSPPPPRRPPPGSGTTILVGSLSMRSAADIAGQPCGHECPRGMTAKPVPAASFVKKPQETKEVEHVLLTRSTILEWTRKVTARRQLHKNPSVASNGREEQLKQPCSGS